MIRVALGAPYLERRADVCARYGENMARGLRDWTFSPEGKEAMTIRGVGGELAWASYLGLPPSAVRADDGPDHVDLDAGPLTVEIKTRRRGSHLSLALGDDGTYKLEATMLALAWDDPNRRDEFDLVGCISRPRFLLGCREAEGRYRANIAVNHSLLDQPERLREALRLAREGRPTATAHARPSQYWDLSWACAQIEAWGLDPGTMGSQAALSRVWRYAPVRVSATQRIPTGATLRLLDDGRLDARMV